MPSSGISRRSAARLGLGAGLGLAAAALTGCDGGGPDLGASGPGGQRQAPRLIGDGSTAYTGRQPNQPDAPTRLEPGQTPPQFVVFSWDGAGELGTGLFPRFLELAREHDARMTFFLSGLYLLPEDKKRLYRPPNNPVGASDIGYLTNEHIKETLKYVRQAWLEGHEIGTHFNGHFCEGSGSVADWTPTQWRSEIEQARTFVKSWRTNTGWHDEPPLPFDYDKELVGGRTPVCSARRTCCRPRANWAGGTTPRHRAGCSAGPGSGTAYGICRCRASRSPGAASKCCPWTGTCWPTSP